jgi:hypothetical protein
MAFGYEYWMVYLPAFNSESFLLFVHNSAGSTNSTKLRDYSSGRARVLGQPPLDVLRGTTIGKTRFSYEPHITTDDSVRDRAADERGSFEPGIMDRTLARTMGWRP